MTRQRRSLYAFNNIREFKQNRPTNWRRDLKACLHSIVYRAEMIFKNLIKKIEFQKKKEEAATQTVPVITKMPHQILICTCLLFHT